MPQIQPVQKAFAHDPMYDEPTDYRQQPSAFTVTVAGGERLDGESPYTYVVEACGTAQAWAKALAWHMLENETVDALVRADLSFEGEPPLDCGYVWSDLRPEYARQATLDDLADQAAEAVIAFQTSISTIADEDDKALPGRQEDYDRALGDAAYAAWPLLLELAANDGRD